MKIIQLIFLTCIFNICNAQIVDSANMPQYLKTREVPSFKLLKMDSLTLFYKYQLKKKTPTIIVYFNPDCGHCQIEAKAIADSISFLKKAQVLFISSAKFGEINNFAKQYNLLNAKNITVGYDEKYYVTRFYRVSYTPFVAAYNSNGKLINIYEGGTSVLNLSKAIK